MRKLLAGEPVEPWQVYFVTTPAFETAAPALQWLTRSVFVGTGERQPLSVSDALLEGRHRQRRAVRSLVRMAGLRPALRL